jgi:putative DNA-invertase from lambdoid prophage Rac
MRTFPYARLSDVCQIIEHQRSHAEAAGFKINEVIADHGVSGVTTKLADRPDGRRLLDKVRAWDHVIVRWDDRLGRNYDDATPTDGRRHHRQDRHQHDGVRWLDHWPESEGGPRRDDRFHGSHSAGAGRATKTAQKAGIAYAEAAAVQQQPEAKYRGRKPSYTHARFDIVRTMLDQHQGVSAVAVAADLSRQTI